MDRKLEKEFKLACESAASMFGGTCIVSDPNKGKPVINDERGVFIRLGTGNKAAGITQKAHNDDFRIDESSLILGSKFCVQFVIDQSDRARN